MAGSVRAVFIDLNAAPLAHLQTPEARSGLLCLQEADFRLFAYANPPPARQLEARLRARLAEFGIILSGFCTSPIAISYSNRHLKIDLQHSWMIGRTVQAVETGNRSGCHSILLRQIDPIAWDFAGLQVPHSFAGDLADAAHTILLHREFLQKTAR